MASDAHPDDDRHWNLESLNKAYQQGYMTGLTGRRQTRHENRAEVLAASLGCWPRTTGATTEERLKRPTNACAACCTTACG